MSGRHRLSRQSCVFARCSTTASPSGLHCSSSTHARVPYISGQPPRTRPRQITRIQRRAELRARANLAPALSYLHAQTLCGLTAPGSWYATRARPDPETVGNETSRRAGAISTRSHGSPCAAVAKPAPGCASLGVILAGGGTQPAWSSRLSGRSRTVWAGLSRITPPDVVVPVGELTNVALEAAARRHTAARSQSAQEAVRNGQHLTVLSSLWA